MEEKGGGPAIPEAAFSASQHESQTNLLLGEPPDRRHTAERTARSALLPPKGCPGNPPCWLTSRTCPQSPEHPSCTPQLSSAPLPALGALPKQSAQRCALRTLPAAGSDLGSCALGSEQLSLMTEKQERGQKGIAAILGGRKKQQEAGRQLLLEQGGSRREQTQDALAGSSLLGRIANRIQP